MGMKISFMVFLIHWTQIMKKKSELKNISINSQKLKSREQQSKDCGKTIKGVTWVMEQQRKRGKINKKYLK